jgi:SH3-like domain-containing protein
MPKKILITTLIITIFTCLAGIHCRAEDSGTGFTGAVNADNINVRVDANTNSPVIWVSPKGQAVEVILERYEWYKIKLPKPAPAFVKKSLLEPIDEKTAKAKADNVNIRMQPNSSAPILGMLKKNEVVAIIEGKGSWLKIEPTANTFGWVHKKFIDRQEKTELPALPEKTVTGENVVVIEGSIQPYGKVINRIATHKLITKDYSTYLLKGNPHSLNPLTYHKVKITGKIISATKEKYPVIEITKLEALD